MAAECVRAFRGAASAMSYELPWTCPSFRCDVFVRLRPGHLEDKLEAVDCYESQRHRSYMNSEVIRSLAVVRGSQVSAQYAEAFEMVRGVL